MDKSVEKKGIAKIVGHKAANGGILSNTPANAPPQEAHLKFPRLDQSNWGSSEAALSSFNSTLTNTKSRIPPHQSNGSFNDSSRRDWSHYFVLSQCVTKFSWQWKTKRHRGMDNTLLALSRGRESRSSRGWEGRLLHMSRGYVCRGFRSLLVFSSWKLLGWDDLNHAKHE